MRQQLWGRARWLWILEATAIVCFLIVLVLADQPGTKLVAVGLLLVRVVISVIQVAEWRRRQRRTADAASDGSTGPLP